MSRRGYSILPRNGSRDSRPTQISGRWNHGQAVDFSVPFDFPYIPVTASVGSGLLLGWGCHVECRGVVGDTAGESMIPHELAPYLLIGTPLAIVVLVTVLSALQCVLFFHGHEVTLNIEDKRFPKDSLFIEVPENVSCDRCGIKPISWMKWLPRGHWNLITFITMTVPIVRPLEYYTVTFEISDWTPQEIRDAEQFWELMNEETEGQYLQGLRA